jgi:hypothetical protein
MEKFFFTFLLFIYLFNHTKNHIDFTYLNLPPNQGSY